ncbi:MAG: hypothetical protein ACTHOK_03800 [Nocardioidaceae bacterium]
MQRQPRAFVHVGLPKTGTSYLQSVLWQSEAEVEAQGLTLLPKPVGSVSATQLMLAVRDRLEEGEDPTPGPELLRRFAADVREAGDKDVLYTQEQLAPAGPKQASRVFRRLPDHEHHVVITARSLARQLPSAWQERVKTRSVLGYDEFLQAVVDRSEEARAFWRYQDLLDVAERWGTHVPPEHVHIVTVPPPGSPPELLLQRFCGVLGLDAGRLNPARSRSNSSLGLTQAELLRRVNVALGDRLPSPRRGYSRVAKWYLVSRALLPQGGQAPLLPGSMRGWVEEQTEQWIAETRERGYHVVGDLADLRPADAHFSDQPPAVSDQEVLESAVAALAELLVVRDQEVRRLDALRRRVAELESQGSRRPAWLRRPTLPALAGRRRSGRGTAAPR